MIDDDKFEFAFLRNLDIFTENVSEENK